MSIFDFVGFCYVILMTCIGTALLVWLVIQGLYRVGGRFLRGAEFEEKAVKDYTPGIQIGIRQ